MNGRKEASPRLGRGLAALLGDIAVQAPPRGAAVREIPLDLLETSPFQPRSTIDPASLDELAQSIRARGILQPILVRPHPIAAGRFQIVAGERRWRAAGVAGLHEVLRRQGLLGGIWCLDPGETLGAGQFEEISRVYAAYPQLNDNDFVREHLDSWLAP